MKRPVKFPFDYTVSGLDFQIYPAPMTRQLINGTTKHYDSFLIYHQEGAKRVQTRRSTWEGVEAYVEEVVSARRKTTQRVCNSREVTVAFTLRPWRRLRCWGFGWMKS
jgi:hypothetical protein